MILININEVHVAIYLAGCFTLYLMLMTKMVNRLNVLEVNKITNIQWGYSLSQHETL